MQVSSAVTMKRFERISAMSKDNPGAWLNKLTSAERKDVAVARGLFAYFPDALARIALHSVQSNEKHNPGQPVHWSREKSSDHEDCVARHSLSIAIDPDSLDGDVPHMVCRAWRALAALQLWLEAKEVAGATTPDWILWRGGRCPVKGDTPLRVQFRTGREINVEHPGALRWEHQGTAGDIVAYCVIPTFADQHPCN
jgi:hypothetical protein